MIGPQQDGRLHWHIMLYSSVLSPKLLAKAAAASSMALQSQIGIEFEDLLTLQLCMKPKFNDPKCVISKQGFT